MSHRHGAEGGEVRPEEFAYAEYTQAEAEVERIQDEMDKVFARAESREAAERVVFEQHAPLMDAAMKRLREAFDRWLEITRRI